MNRALAGILVCLVVVHDVHGYLRPRYTGSNWGTCDGSNGWQASVRYDSGSAWNGVSGGTSHSGKLCYNGQYSQISAWTSGTHQIKWEKYEGGVITQTVGPNDWVSDGTEGNPSVHHYIDWNGGASYTNHVMSGLSLTNTGGWFDGGYNVKWYTNAPGGTPTLARDDWYSLNPGDVLAIPGSTNLFGTGTDYSFQVFGPGSAATDFVPQLVGSSDASASVTGTDEGQLGNVGSKTDVDGINQLPQFTPTTTNSLVADRQNAQAIAESVRDIGQALGSRLDGIRTNSSSAPDYSDVLNRIQTNTLASADRLAGATNLLSNATNLLNSITNLLTGATNALAHTNEWHTNFGSATNQSVTNWAARGDGFWGSMSNSLASASASWQASVPDPSGSPLRVALPRGMFFDLEAPWASLLADELFGAASWLQDVLIMCILIAAFWFSYNLLADRVAELQMGGAIAGKAGGLAGSVFGIFLTRVFQIVVIEAVTLVLVYLPSLATAAMDGYNWKPLGVEGFPAKVAEGPDLNGPMARAMQKYYTILGLWVPWATLWVTIVNFLAFRLLLDRIANFAWAFIRGISVAAGLLLLFHGLSDRVQAASVHVENWTGAAVVVSNTYEVVSVPVGSSDLLLLEGEDWSFGAVTFEIPERGTFDPLLTLRFSTMVSTNVPAPVELIIYDFPSVEMGFWWGWGSGLAVFGFAWMVSAVREGVTIAYRDYG